MQNDSSFWARQGRDIPENWPCNADGTPEIAAKLDIQWELDSMADITRSMLESFGIPSFQNGSLGRVLGGFAMEGVEIWVPASRLEEAQALLSAPEFSGDDPDAPSAP